MQEHWSGLPCPPPGDIPDPGIKPKSLAFPALAGGCFINSATWEAAGSQRDIPLMTKVMRKEARHTQRRDQASGVPLDILEHLPPKSRVCLLYCFVLSLLTLRGAVPHHHFALSEKELTYSSS